MIFQDQDINSIIEPEKVSFWPLQPGWYMLMGLVGILIAYLGWKKYQAWLKNAYKREAIETIKSLSNGDDFFFRLNSTIKSVAIQSFGREEVARLSGKEWTTFLSQTTNGLVFNSTVLDYLKSLPYERQKDIIEDSVINTSKTDAINWIKKHK